MASGEDPSKNPFIRFRQHVDGRMATAMESLASLPSAVSRGLSSTSRHVRETTDQPGLAGNTTSSSSSSGSPFSGPSRLDSYYTRPDAFTWTDWFFRSAYSPFNLHHLPRPRPADRAAYMGRDDFTFADAFEDLLAASSGRPLMDLNERCARNRSELISRTDTFGWMSRAALGLGDWTYLERWHQLGLLDAHPSWARHSDAAPSSTRPEARGSLPDSERPLEKEWKEIASALDGQVFEVLNDFFKSLEQPRFGQDSAPRRSAEAATRPEAPASEAVDDIDATFDELFSMIKSDFAEPVAKSLNTLTQVFKDAAEESVRAQQEEKRRVQLPASPNEAASVRREESTEEYLDETGNMHTITTVRFLNRDGVEVGRATTGRTRLKEVSDTSLKQEGRAAESKESAETERKSGWFWR